MVRAPFCARQSSSACRAAFAACSAASARSAAAAGSPSGASSSRAADPSPTPDPGAPAAAGLSTAVAHPARVARVICMGPAVREAGQAPRSANPDPDPGLGCHGDRGACPGSPCCSAELRTSCLWALRLPCRQACRVGVAGTASDNPWLPDPEASMSTIGALTADWEGLASPSGALRSAICTHKGGSIHDMLPWTAVMHLEEHNITRWCSVPGIICPWIAIVYMRPAVT